MHLYHIKREQRLNIGPYWGIFPIGIPWIRLGMYPTPSHRLILSSPDCLDRVDINNSNYSVQLKLKLSVDTMRIVDISNSNC